MADTIETIHFTVGEFVEWAKQKPADEYYPFGDNDNCAVAQFLKETGRSEFPSVGVWDWDDSGGVRGGPILRRGNIPDELSDVLSQYGTYGALLRGLRVSA